MDQTAENLCKAPQQWMRHIFKHSPALVCVTNFRGVFLDINEAGVKMLGGRLRDEYIGKISIRQFYTDGDDRKRLQEIIARDGFVQEFETRFKRQDGGVIDVAITGAAYRNRSGKIIGYEAFIVDITGRKKAEQALKESEEKYRTIVETSLSAILVHKEGLVLFANQRCAELTGYDHASQLIGRPFWEDVHPEDRAIVRERGLKREKGQLTPDHYNFRLLDRDGKTARWVELRAVHAMYMGQPAAVVNFIDITLSKKAEEEIRHLSRRLVKVREEERKMLAADLHDEMGQTLTAMRFDLDFLQKALPPESAEQRQRYDALVRSVERLADIARKTTSYLRPQVLEHVVLIPALMRHIDEFKSRQPEIRVNFRHYGLKKRLHPEIELTIYRILQEGLTNIAKHACASHVEIILTYSHPNVILTIRDDGIGCEQLTEMVKSRNPGKHGRGIGLLSMIERVSSFGGSIDISSAPGKGTALRADIPV